MKTFILLGMLLFCFGCAAMTDVINALPTYCTDYDMEQARASMKACRNTCTTPNACMACNNLNQYLSCTPDLSRAGKVEW